MNSNYYFIISLYNLTSPYTIQQSIPTSCKLYITRFFHNYSKLCCNYTYDSSESRSLGIMDHSRYYRYLSLLHQMSAFHRYRIHTFLVNRYWMTHKVVLTL